MDRQCPNCRADIEPDWRYCPYCAQYVPLSEEDEGEDEA